jgi:hypothetical protein
MALDAARKRQKGECLGCACKSLNCIVIGLALALCQLLDETRTCLNGRQVPLAGRGTAWYSRVAATVAPPSVPQQAALELTRTGLEP